MEQTTHEIKENLKEICNKGFEIRDVLKGMYAKPIRENYDITEIMISPHLFFFSLFENFWKLFKIASEDIENPLVQPWIRVIIEQASDIFDYHSKKDDDKKKEIACKYWLCALGFIGGKKGNLKYDNFLNFIENKQDKTKFLKLKEEGYSPKKFHIEWDNLFAKINEKEIPAIMEKYFLNMKGNPIKKHQIESFYKDMSLYHHPNILITQKLEEELKDKSHLFRCFALTSFCGMSLIKLSENITNKSEKEFIDKINPKINELIQKSYETKNTN